NQFQMHNEHAYYFPRHPEIGATADRLTNEEMLELDAHCRRFHVELVPNLQSFGHMQNILSLPRYRHLAETGFCWSLAPTVEECYSFLDELYADFIPAFSSQQLNVNCDETYDLGRGRSAERLAQVGPGRLYLEHMLRVRELAASYGKRIQMWGDILLQHPEVIPDLPADVTLLDWHYEAEETYPSTALFAGHGRRFLVCPGTSSWNTLFPRIDNANANIRTLAREGAQHGAAGLLNTDWGDGGHYQPLGNSWYGYAFGAEQAWSGGNTSDAGFEPAFGRLFFGPEKGEAVVAAIRQLAAVNRLPGMPIPNASHTVFALFDEPLLGRMIEGLPHKTVQEMREVASAAEAVFMAAAPGNREEQVLRELAFSARLIAEAGHKVALSQLVRAGWSQIAGGLLKPEAARQDIERWLLALEERWEAMIRLRAEFMDVWLRRARPKGMAETLRLYRGVLARYDVAAHWLRSQKEALQAGRPLDADLASYGTAEYRVLWDRPFLAELLQDA
ncbi:MAG: beta-N-acetylhexosaminidase, partial [Anaerolineae bacterium]|nr:beta-N-acetylhexosaminidase [Anaerolineae bacterium]